MARALKDPREMTAGEINLELDALDVKRARLVEKFVAAGRGHETPSETRTKSDPLALEWIAATDRSDALRREIDRRYGPGAPPRLPRGFGPIREGEDRETVSPGMPSGCGCKEKLDAVAEADESNPRRVTIRGLAVGDTVAVKVVAQHGHAGVRAGQFLGFVPARIESIGPSGFVARVERDKIPTPLLAQHVPVGGLYELHWEDRGRTWTADVQPVVTDRLQENPGKGPLVPLAIGDPVRIRIFAEYSHGVFKKGQTLGYASGTVVAVNPSDFVARVPAGPLFPHEQTIILRWEDEGSTWERENPVATADAQEPAVQETHSLHWIRRESGILFAQGSRGYYEIVKQADGFVPYGAGDFSPQSAGNRFVSLTAAWTKEETAKRFVEAFDRSTIGVVWVPSIGQYRVTSYPRGATSEVHETAIVSTHPMLHLSVVRASDAGSRIVRETSVPLGECLNGLCEGSGACVPWIKVVRDPRSYDACMKVADEIGPIKSSADAVAIVAPEILRNDQETFVALLLDPHLRVRGASEIALGGRTETLAPIPDTLRLAILEGSTAFVIFHGHPSGKVTPSEADRQLTQAMREAGEAVGIPCFDHIIAGLATDSAPRQPGVGSIVVETPTGPVTCEYFSFADEEAKKKGK